MNQAEHIIPTRARPFEKTGKKTPFWLKSLLGRELAPSRDEYRAVTDALWDGDQPMDDLVSWMFEENPKQRRAQVQKAFEGDLTDAPQAVLDFFETLSTPPAWIDFSLIEEGVDFIHSVGISAGYVLRDLALMGGYMLSGFNQSLVMTGALNKGTAQRIAETGKWWIDCTEHNGMRRFGPGYKSTLHVRMVHSLVRRGLDKHPDWDHSRWGRPLSQIDMVATYLGFSVVMILGLRKMGIPVLPRESRAVIHLWSYVCWIMGVEAKWLVQSEQEGMVLLNHTYATQSLPDDTSKELAKSLSEEPLERSYGRFQSLKRKLSYHQHLGMSQYFLGKDKMAKLGFEDLGLPWYPLVSNAPRALVYTAGHFLPGQRKRQQKLGRQAQMDMLASMFGEKEHAIINPDTDHPAHV
ncbi:MAG: hypothetical protein CMK89_12600 [Pseudomonadales bacterium]|nr:hypothetical protein [Pseudomonadales bacterium]